LRCTEPLAIKLLAGHKRFATNRVEVERRRFLVVFGCIAEEPPMNDREQSIREARNLLTDNRLINFFREIGETWLCDRLERGESLDGLFYTGDEYGLILSASRCDVEEELYAINFGFMAAPLAGTGRYWGALFNTDGMVEALSHCGNWVS
jgi:hypothetical protein